MNLGLAFPFAAKIPAKIVKKDRRAWFGLLESQLQEDFLAPFPGQLGENVKIWVLGLEWKVSRIGQLEDKKSEKTWKIWI